jgi:WhiB family redox-sensing transcriptional regulator
MSAFGRGAIVVEGAPWGSRAPDVSDPSVEFIEWLMSKDDHEFPGLAQIVHRPAWQSRAACRGEPITTFFQTRQVNYDRAAALCATCAVRRECLDAVIAVPAIVGFWAGTSERERRRLRRAVA